MHVEYLFVYGTLRSGFQPDGQVRTIAAEEARAVLSEETEHVATIKLPGYDLYKIKWYPGIVRSANKSSFVIGDLLRIKNAERLFKTLDMFEMCSPSDPEPHEYSRIVESVATPDGRQVNAHLYVRNASVDGCMLIETGDFLK